MADMHSSSGPLALPWQTGFAQLGSAFLTYLQPTPLPDPQWVAHNKALAQQLQLPEGLLETDAALQAFTGNTLLPGSQPYASVYSGHQFGVWAGQLGDGRAICLGETASGWELQLKGAGRTPTHAAAMAVPCCAPAFVNTCAARPCMRWAFPPRGHCA